MDKITVVDLEVFAYHGVLEEEKKEGQMFYISFEAFLDLWPSALDDDLNLSVSYAQMCQDVKNYVTSHVFDLIETVAEGVAHTLLKHYELIKSVVVEVKKPSAPIGEKVAYPSVVIKRSWEKVYLSIGSNMGDRKNYIDEAIRCIEASEEVKGVKVSRIIETEPWGNTDQPAFLNCALEVQTIMPPKKIMAWLLEIEASFDRIRTVQWGPRTLDIDVLLYGTLVTSDDFITLPHPLMHKRRFVLEPLCEIAPNAVHPIYGKRIFELLETL